MKKFSFLSLVVVCLLSFSLILSGCGSSDEQVTIETKAEESLSEAPQPSTTESTDPRYTMKEDLETILFIGLDKFEAPVNELGYLNDQQCDFLLLVVADHKNQSCDILHLNRDTMTEIRRLGVGSKEAGKFIGQLALAHTYGSGGSDSCLNTTKAVSKFLKGAPVDHYIAMTMEGVGELNDLVGGVEVTIPIDMTNVDPEFEKGAKVLLHGDQALLFVRSRMTVGDGSNLSRMTRQRTYLNALYEKLMAHIAEDKGFASSSLLKMTSYFQSDLSVNTLSDLCDQISSYEVNPISSIEGEARVGEKFMEFYPDEDSLNSVLIDIFCE